MDWKDQAADMFFNNQKSIDDISKHTGKSRQSVSGYLKQLPGYQDEKRRRKAENQDRRKVYKREKQREYRSSIPMEATTDTIRREHDIAVMLLSRERFY